MAVSSIDNHEDHLYPAFREKLRRVREAAEAALGEPWVIVEGYRSAERQLWLYAQGRTRPGKIVTWMKTPKWHGTGLAADCMPKKRGYQAPMAWWERYRAIYLGLGLDNPAWTKGDLGHVQLTDAAIRNKSLAWARAGFPAGDGGGAPASEGVKVVVAGHLLPDAAGSLEGGKAWAMLRPVADALDLVISELRGPATKKEAVLLDDDKEYVVPAVLRGGRAFVALRDLPARVRWEDATDTVTLDPLG